MKEQKDVRQRIEEGEFAQSAEISASYLDEDILIIDNVKVLQNPDPMRFQMNMIASCQRGSLRAELNGREFTVEKGDIFISPPNSILDIKEVSEDFACTAMCVSNHGLLGILRSHISVWNRAMYVSKVSVLKMNEVDMVFYSKFTDLVRLCLDPKFNDRSSWKPYRREIVETLLKSALLAVSNLLLTDLPKETLGTSASDFFDKFLEMLQQSEIKHQPVEYFAHPEYSIDLLFCNEEEDDDSNQVTENGMERDSISRQMDCNIQISTNKPSTIAFQPEGTNTAGDLGAAASLTYTNRNLFRGSEQLSIELRGAYEAITGLEGYQDQNYTEYSVEGKLVFPRFLAPFLSRNFRRRQTANSELSASWNLQNRPEFHRRVFSTAWRYRWTEPRHHLAWRFDLLDLNYVYMPWISETFKRDYLDNAENRNAILRYNYEDLFIMKMGFGLSYSDGVDAVRVNVESSGNLLSGVSKAFGFKVNSQGQRTLFNIAYAQYAKFDVDYTHLMQFDKRNALALHAGIGVAYPYGNSTVLPFEKRYFSGGANSVRGWGVRELGPGKFKGTDGRIDFINQTGDVKLDLNAEYRTSLFWKFEGAAFIDAGNIWTLRNYQDQPGGQFKIDEFYKQIAVAYGLGLRLNFDYFILRLDMGMKAINPAYGTKEEHWAIIHPKLDRDFAFHFAVGLPF